MADSLRVATYNLELYRDGPGLLLRDIVRGEDAQVQAAVREIAEAAPDIIALQGLDYDLENKALSAFADALRLAGHDLPHLFAAPPNAGLATDLDLDGDGKTGGPADAQGYGRFFGQGSMAMLSRYPIRAEQAVSYADMLWRDLPGAMLPVVDGTPFPSAAALAVQRLSSHGHWVVPVKHPKYGELSILSYHATPPVFDGPEDRNGRRNHDETIFWLHLLDGTVGDAPDAPYVLMGDANLDPNGGDGRGAAMAALLADDRLQDPLGAQPTVTWQQTGPLRVSYILPSADWRVTASGVRPIEPDASRHSLIWVDLTR